MGLVDLFRRASSDFWAEGAHSGWAFDSLRRTLRRALLLAVCVWQVVMLWALLNTPAPLLDRWLLGLAHAGLMVLALLARSDRLPGGLALVLVYPVALWDWAVTDSIEGVLAFAACWLAHLAAAATAVVVRGRRAILLTVGAAAVLPIGIHLINPDWDAAVPLSVGMTSLVIMAAVRLGLPFLLDFAHQADAEAAMAEEEIRTTAALRSASSEAAEDARILHDTVINTLGAIANGGAGITDLDAVRERCARDAELVEELQSARAERERRDTNLWEIFDAPGLTVLRAGADDADLRRAEQMLPLHVIGMIVRASKEVLQNASKHAQVDQVIVDVRVDDLELVITIEDEGIGFDGHVPPDRGLANSVMSRADEAGVAVVLDTSAGNGTTVTFSRRLGESPAVGEPGHQAEHDVDDIVTTLRLRAGWLWACGVTAVGFVIEPLNRVGQLTAIYPMLVMNTLLLTFAWFSRGDDGRLPRRVVVALAVGTSVAFVLSAAAVDFGRTDVIFWQAVAPTGPLVVLIASDCGRLALRAALGLFAGTMVVMTAIVWQDSSGAASIIPVGGLASLGLAAAWLGFQRAIDVVGRQASSDHQVAFRARVDAAVRVAADDVRRRWRAAGLHQSVELLKSVAGGRVEPSAASTRTACAQEEAYLRQLTQLNPDLVRMGLWCARALHQGRQRETQFVVRTGEVDAPDEETAEMLGTVLLSAVSSIPRGAVLSATIFPTSDGLRMTLVSPGSHLGEAHRTWDPSQTSSMTYQTIQDQDLMEIVVPSTNAGRAPTLTVGARVR